MKEFGATAREIQEHGRRSSDCYLRYLERTAEERLSLTARMYRGDSCRAGGINGGRGTQARARARAGGRRRLERRRHELLPGRSGGGGARAMAQWRDREGGEAQGMRGRGGGSQRGGG